MSQFRPLLSAATLIVMGAALPALAQAPAPDAPPPKMAHHGMKHGGPHAGPMARLTVTGQGQSAAQPDMATVTLGVSTRATTAADAMAQNATEQAKVIDTLKAEGIEARDIQTAGLNLSAMMDYSDQGQAPKLTGYAAQNTVTVRVRDLAGLGAVLDKLVASGANEINGIGFSRDDMTAAEDEAQTAAVADARRRAEIMAEAAGMRLGRLMALSDAQVASPPRPMMAMRAEAKSADTPIEAGEMTVDAQVTAIFELVAMDAPDAMPGDMPGAEPQGDAPPPPAN